MTFRQSILTCFRKYFTFSGRATRSEYWWFFLFILLASIVLGILDGILFGAGTYETEVTDTSVSAKAEADGPLSTLFSLGTFLPMLAAGWRRMHDTGRSGLYLLYPLIAMAGVSIFIALTGTIETFMSDNPAAAFEGILGIILIAAFVVIAISPFIVLWWLTRPSQPGQNQYGPNPYEVTP